MDKIYDTTNALLELSADQTARGFRISAAASEKMAVRLAQLEPLPDALAAVIDLIEPTENALRMAQKQLETSDIAEQRQAIGHKIAMLKAVLGRIEESIESC